MEQPLFGPKYRRAVFSFYIRVSLNLYPPMMKFNMKYKLFFVHKIIRESQDIDNNNNDDKYLLVNFCERFL